VLGVGAHDHSVNLALLEEPAIGVVVRQPDQDILTDERRCATLVERRTWRRLSGSR